MIWIILIGSAFPAGANPIPARDARIMDERPKEWLDQPGDEVEAALIRQFAGFGISRGLLSPATIDLLESNFARFAPLMVRAQEPPFLVQPSLQRWFREHATGTEADSMKLALRAWLDSEEMPLQMRSHAEGQEAEVKARNRLIVIESLGDWGDRMSIPRLRELRALDPEIVEASIRRIEDPAHGDPFVPDRAGQLVSRRSASEVDSMVVTSSDAVSHKPLTWAADKGGRNRLWSVLKESRVPDPHAPYRDPKAGPKFSGELVVVFRDHRRVEFQQQGDRWTLVDQGRVDSEIDVTNDALGPRILAELTRVGLVPENPRFVEESVALWISPGSLRVIGTYHFEGAAKKGFLPLAYPFPDDPTLGKPRLKRVSLRTIEDSKELAVDVDTSVLPWRFGLHPNDQLAYELQVEYEQSVAADSATYVLRSTREWERPLRKCWYGVTFDTTLGDPHLNYPFQEARGVTTVRRFYWSTDAFLPDRDLVVRWEPAFRISQP